MSTRNPNDMDPRLFEKYLLWDAEMKAAGLHYCLTRVACSYKEQVALYAQGRESLYDTNRLRAIAGLSPINADANRKITWTLDSMHVVRLDDKDPGNDAVGSADLGKVAAGALGKAHAFDFAITKDGKPVWDIKVDTNQVSGPDYDEAGHLWELVGGVWGGRWKNPDRPHCQLWWDPDFRSIF